MACAILPGIVVISVYILSVLPAIGDMSIQVLYWIIARTVGKRIMQLRCL